MDIEKSVIRVSRCCRSPLFVVRDGKEYCPCGKENPEVFTPWFDASGDRMFELVSDVSGR